MPTVNVLSNDIENIQIFPIKCSIFTAEKNLCILHGQVFVMLTPYEKSMITQKKLTRNGHSL